MTKHKITEHHYSAETGKTWTVDVGHTTNIRRTVSELAEKRRAGDIPATLSSWTVGSKKRVVAQFASRLFDRQMADQEAFFDSLADAIE